jgi:Fe-S cluster assembly protein SufD
MSQTMGQAMDHTSELARTWHEASETAERAVPGAAWFRAERRSALARFLAAGLPSVQEEDWRYTDLAGAGAALARLLPSPAPPAATEPAPSPWHPDEICLTLRGGRLVAGPIELPGGLRVRTLPDLAAEARLPGGDWGAEPVASLQALADLNTALLADAVIIDVAAGAQIASPLRLRVLAPDGGVAATRIVLDVGRGARLTLIEEQSGGGDAVVSTITTVRCAEDATLRHVRLRTPAASATALDAQTFVLAAGAQLHLTTADMGSVLGRHDLDIRLTGDRAEAHIHSLLLATSSAHLDQHIRIRHAARNTTSRTLARSIAGGRSRTVFNGRIVVDEGAGGTDAELRNANLLLDPDSEVDTKPELEIYADEVRCSHGATTGQLDAQALFYLRSRGIDQAVAARILVGAFALESVRAVGDERVRDALSARVEARLGRLAPELAS